nr:scaffolding protein [uncultured Mediterranean phage uvMED]
MTDQTATESELDSTQELSVDDALKIMIKKSQDLESQDQPVQDDKEAEETEEETDVEAEGTEETEGLTEEESDKAEESAEESKPEIEYVTEGLVEVDGEAIDIQELKQGHLRQSDYTRKTQALAEKRNEAEETQRQYETQLNALSVAAVGDLSKFQNVDWERLKAQDPEQHKTVYAQYERVKNNADWLQQQIATYNQQQAQREEAEAEAKAVEAVQTLKATIPNWSNELYAKIGQYAASQGIDQAEFKQIVDPRLITVLHNSMLFDGAKQVTKKKIAKSPKKTLSGSKSAPKSSNQRGKKAMQRLQKSGSMEDALEVYVNRQR